MRVLDLYCGGGGAALGYLSLGWDVEGVDHEPFPQYPGQAMIVVDAIEYLLGHADDYDLIHASPPCLTHSDLTKGNRSRGWEDGHTDLIPATREALEVAGKPWVMENVVGAGLRQDLMLCGSMFKLPLYRHRVFEASFALRQIRHRIHMLPTWYPYDKRGATYGREYGPGWAIPVHGDNNAPAPYQYYAMGIRPDQMDRKALIQAIPPAFTKYIGEQFLSTR